MYILSKYSEIFFKKRIFKKILIFLDRDIEIQKSYESQF